MRTLLSLLATSAHAAVPCGTPPFALPGCGQPAENVIATTVIPNLAVFGIRLATLLSLLFIIISALGMMIAGDDSGRSTAKKGIMYSLAGLLLAISSGVIVSFVANEEFGQGMDPTQFLFGGLIGGAIRILLTLTNVALTLVILYQGIQMLLAQGKTDQFTSARNAIFWAVIAAVVVNISRVLVNIVLSLQL